MSNKTNLFELAREAGAFEILQRHTASGLTPAEVVSRALQYYDERHESPGNPRWVAINDRSLEVDLLHQRNVLEKRHKQEVYKMNEFVKDLGERQKDEIKELTKEITEKLDDAFAQGVARQTEHIEDTYTCRKCGTRPLRDNLK